MRNRFIFQPFEDGFDLRDFLQQVLSDQSIDRLEITVAWAKRSGLRVVEGLIRAFRARRGFVRIIVGISEGGATRQGLELALELADEVFVFHDPTGRTFHPKVYGAYGTQTAVVLVGSHNLTRGGAVQNYEAGNICELNLSLEDDRVYLDSVVKDYFGKLLSDTDVCVTLDKGQLEQIIANTSYRVGDEDAPRFSRTPASATAVRDLEESDSVTEDEPTAPGAVFGRSKHKLRSAPVASAPPTARIARFAIVGAPMTPPPQSGGPMAANAATRAAASVVAKRWYKELDEANAQQPSGANTNPTGHLTLTKNSFPIDHTTYFRDVFFKSVNWSPIPTQRERAQVAFDLAIHGNSHGVLTLEVDHYANYVAAQRNRATTLRWGEYLNSYLRNNDHVGDTVTLELLSDGSYRLVIDTMPTGEFMP